MGFVKGIIVTNCFLDRFIARCFTLLQNIVPFTTFNNFKLGFQHNLKLLAEDTGLLAQIVGLQSQTFWFLGSFIDNMTCFFICLVNNILSLLLSFTIDDLSFTLRISFDFISSFLSNDDRLIQRIFQIIEILQFFLALFQALS